jgi:hypothetical protein
VTNALQTQFPTVEEVMILARTFVNDTFPGLQGTQGRILTDAAPFTIPWLNHALRTLQRKLRGEGVSFPIKEQVLLGVPPVVKPDPGVFVNVGFLGTNNGTTSSASPALPPDCVQPLRVRQRQSNSGQPFRDMQMAQGGLPSTLQGAWLGLWEWRGYAIWMNGATSLYDLMIRYTSGQPPLSASLAPAAFPTTNIYILDSQDALAGMIAKRYGAARGAKPEALTDVQALVDDAIADIANEFVRQMQNGSYSRPSYGGGGSTEGTSGPTGQSGVVA